MLHISDNNIDGKLDINKYKSFKVSQSIKYFKRFRLIFNVSAILGIVILFLPWTQNVQGTGRVTAVRPEQRPQKLQSQIPGRIVNWYVREGDTVNVGDTLLFISEIKEEYFDPQMLQRLQDELAAKTSAIDAYEGKVEALKTQIEVLRENRELKFEQAQLNVQADSAALEATRVRYELAKIQFLRADTLFKEGINSRFQFEQRKQNQQDAQAKFQEAKNRYENSITQLRTVLLDFNEKISKSESEFYSAQSDALATRAEVAKLQNKTASMKVRQGYYYITAPQKGLISRTIRSGVGENIKVGDIVAEIMPLDYQLAVDIYIRPMDLSLIGLGQEARIEFDGWPAIVFSGWPSTSFGTFGAKVIAIDNVIDANGNYKVMLAADTNDVDWPELVRFGSGARGILLLSDVPVWYELWRQLNGFPPNFYRPNTNLNLQNSSSK